MFLLHLLIKFSLRRINNIYSLLVGFREYKESQKYNETNRNDPVLLVEDVNHGQVASGKIVRES